MSSVPLCAASTLTASSKSRGRPAFSLISTRSSGATNGSPRPSNATWWRRPSAASSCASRGRHEVDDRAGSREPSLAVTQERLPVQPLAVHREARAPGPAGEHVQLLGVGVQRDVDVRRRARPAPDGDGQRADDHVDNALGLEHVGETEESRTDRPAGAGLSHGRAVARPPARTGRAGHVRRTHAAPPAPPGGSANAISSKPRRSRSAGDEAGACRTSSVTARSRRSHGGGVQRVSALSGCVMAPILRRPRTDRRRGARRSGRAGTDPRSVP